MSFLVPGAVRSNNSPHLCASWLPRALREAAHPPWNQAAKKPDLFWGWRRQHTVAHSHEEQQTPGLDLREKRASSARKSETGF